MDSGDIPRVDQEILLHTMVSIASAGWPNCIEKNFPDGQYFPQLMVKKIAKIAKW